MWLFIILISHCVWHCQGAWFSEFQPLGLYNSPADTQVFGLSGPQYMPEGSDIAMPSYISAATEVVSGRAGVSRESNEMYMYNQVDADPPSIFEIAESRNLAEKDTPLEPTAELRNEREARNKIEGIIKEGGAHQNVDLPVKQVLKPETQNTTDAPFRDLAKKEKKRGGLFGEDEPTGPLKFIPIYTTLDSKYIHPTEPIVPVALPFPTYNVLNGYGVNNANLYEDIEPFVEESDALLSMPYLPNTAAMVTPLPANTYQEWINPYKSALGRNLKKKKQKQSFPYSIGPSYVEHAEPVEPLPIPVVIHAAPEPQPIIQQPIYVSRPSVETQEVITSVPPECMHLQPFIKQDDSIPTFEYDPIGRANELQELLNQCKQQYQSQYTPQFLKHDPHNRITGPNARSKFTGKKTITEYIPVTHKPPTKHLDPDLLQQVHTPPHAFHHSHHYGRRLDALHDLSKGGHFLVPISKEYIPLAAWPKEVAVKEEPVQKVYKKPHYEYPAPEMYHPNMDFGFHPWMAQNPNVLAQYREYPMQEAPYFPRFQGRTIYADDTNAYNNLRGDRYVPQSYGVEEPEYRRVEDYGRHEDKYVEVQDSFV